jgi:hypothetical protein
MFIAHLGSSTFSAKSWPLDHRVKYMQERTGYMIGFGGLSGLLRTNHSVELSEVIGLITTLCSSFGPPLVNMAVFALIYPFVSQLGFCKVGSAAWMGGLLSQLRSCAWFFATLVGWALSDGFRRDVRIWPDLPPSSTLEEVLRLVTSVYVESTDLDHFPGLTRSYPIILGGLRWIDL